MSHAAQYVRFSVVVLPPTCGTGELKVSTVWVGFVNQERLCSFVPFCWKRFCVEHDLRKHARNLESTREHEKGQLGLPTFRYHNGVVARPGVGCSVI